MPFSRRRPPSGEGCALADRAPVGEAVQRAGGTCEDDFELRVMASASRMSRRAAPLPSFPKHTIQLLRQTFFFFSLSLPSRCGFRVSFSVRGPRCRCGGWCYQNTTLSSPPLTGARERARVVSSTQHSPGLPLPHLPIHSSLIRARAVGDGATGRESRRKSPNATQRFTILIFFFHRTPPVGEGLQ